MDNDKMIVGSIVFPPVAGPAVYIPPHERGPLPQDIIKAIAEDIGKDLVAYIEVMYPAAIKATSSTFKTSMKNHVYNAIMEAVKLNDVEKIRQRLAANAAHRKKWVGMYRKMRRPSKHRNNKEG